MRTADAHPARGAASMEGLAFEEISARQQLSRAITNPVLNYLAPVSILKWFMRRSSSPLVAEMFRWPGSWKSVEITYANAEPTDWI
ncbi:MAG: hypothetical protein EHM42_05465, partial [Planctomycetaceae bacterium]